MKNLWHFKTHHYKNEKISNRLGEHLQTSCQIKDLSYIESSYSSIRQKLNQQMGKDMNREFTKEDIYTASRYMKRS